MGVNFLDRQAPDATGALQVPLFFLRRCGIAEKIFEDVKERLERAGLKRPRRDNRWRCNHRRLSSAKNREGKRDPEMRQAKKGNQWRFGRSEHVGVDIR